jgi:hypothetical protein
MKSPLGLITPLTLAIVGLQLLPATAAHAVLFGGGGSKRTDCLAVLDAPINAPASKPRFIVCEDGAACDEDMTINAVCEVSVVVCANSSAFPDCSFTGVDNIVVDHALDDGDPKFDPEFQALQTVIDNDIAAPTTEADKCTAASKLRVHIKGPLARNRCRRNSKKLRLITESQVIDGRVFVDKDTLKIVCLPSTAAGGCDPQVLFDSTFDRIQRQVLNQSCALSSCHDSQSQAGSLLLETGASHASLINQDPNNPAALGANWKRVTQINPSLGDPTTSFLFRKITGDLPTDAYGARMPFGKPKLPGVLRDLIETWIQNGAPDDAGGWIPGTF